MNQQCAICVELRAGSDTRLSSALDDSRYANAVLFVTDHFAVIPSVGPLTVGHSLVVTRRHSSNVIADLDQSELDELGRVCCESSKKLLAGEPGQSLFYFEHGSRCELKSTLCSTTHGHLHQLPLRERNISDVLRSAGGQKFEVGAFRDLAAIVGTLQEYIVAFSLSPNRDCLGGIVMDASNAPSQYVRKLIADGLGSSRWNWKTDTNPDLLRETLALGFQPNRRVSADTF
jgi:diadenosine tetraphosphate (Ap4A) HIT family hydrolase